MFYITLKSTKKLQHSILINVIHLITIFTFHSTYFSGANLGHKAIQNLVFTGFNKFYDFKEP